MPHKSSISRDNDDDGDDNDNSGQKELRLQAGLKKNLTISVAKGKYTAGG